MVKRLFWSAIAVLVIAILVTGLGIAGIIAPGKPEDVVRYDGLGLTVAGMLLVFRSFSARRSQYGADTLLDVIRKGSCAIWGKFSRRSHTAVVGATLSGVSVMGMHANLKVSLGPNATLEQKIEYLLKQNDHMGDKIFAHEVELDATKREHKELINDLRKELGARIVKQDDAIRSLATGDLHLDELGALMLVVGAVFMAIPIELVLIWRGLFG